MKNERRAPFCWQDKTYLRKMRKDYQKSELSKLRNLYLTLTEIESDNRTKDDCNVVKHYTKTIATYSGLSKDWIPKGLKILQDYGLITIIEKREHGKYKGKTIVFNELLPQKTVTGKTVNGKSVNGNLEPSDEQDLIIDETYTPPVISNDITSPPGGNDSTSEEDSQHSALQEEGKGGVSSARVRRKKTSSEGGSKRNYCQDDLLPPIMLKEVEYKKLVERFNEDVVKESIEELAAYMQSKGKRYKSHYATLINWCKKKLSISRKKSRVDEDDLFIMGLPSSEGGDVESVDVAGLRSEVDTDFEKGFVRGY